MKAISVHQPFAAMIIAGKEDLPYGLPRKRVENRSWVCPYIGEEIAIHAAATTARFEKLRWPKALKERAALGAIVGTVKVVACIAYVPGVEFDFVGKSATNGSDLNDYTWVASHVHAEGPVCWVLANAKRFIEPVPWKGQQGFFSVRGPKFEEQLARAIAVSHRDVGVYL